MADIIIIDDEADLRSTMRRILEGAGHQVREAGDGNEGIRLFHQRPADLVITDIFMPEKEGMETIQELRGEQEDVKILAVSGGGRMAHVDPLEDAELFGADGTLAKPFTVEELRRKVEELLGGG